MVLKGWVNDDLTIANHQQGLSLAQQYCCSWYNSLIASAALLAECRVLYSELLQHGPVMGSMVISNPFPAE